MKLKELLVAIFLVGSLIILTDGALNDARAGFQWKGPLFGGYYKCTGAIAEELGRFSRQWQNLRNDPWKYLNKPFEEFIKALCPVVDDPDACKPVPPPHVSVNINETNGKQFIVLTRIAAKMAA